MGSVTSSIECPNCGHEAFEDYRYKTGEISVDCMNCGYHYSSQLIDPNKSFDELEEEDYKIVEIKNPYGAFMIKSYSSLAIMCGPLENEDHLNEIIKDCYLDPSIEFLKISQVIDGEIKLQVLIDNGPEFDSAGFTEKDRII